MKKIIVAIIIIVIGLVILNLGARFNEDSNFKVRFHVYKQHSENPIDILLRRINTNLDTLIKAEIIEPINKELALYKVDNDIYGGTPDYHYLVYDRDYGTINELKSNLLFSKIADPDNVNLDTVDSYSINIVQFRNIYEPYFDSNEYIVDKYARLLANSTDSLNFKRIKSYSDIEQLKSVHDYHTSFEPDDILKNFDFLNNLIDDQEYIYWFYDKGIIKITLEFKGKHLDKVSTHRLGNLGLEVIHI
jgi:hypothetical protein